jgi:hypothetical protein
MSYHDDSSNIGCTIIFCIVAVVVCFLFAMCQNSLVDKDLNKVSATAKSEYLEHNTESCGNKLVGGNSMKKAVYATYQGIAKENNISVYEAVKQTRGKFAGQFKTHFRSLGSFLALPNIRNAYRSDDMGKQVVIVHFTWQECSGSGDNHHCWTEHDEVVIPELVQPKMDYDEDRYENQSYDEPEETGTVGIDYEGFDMQINHQPTVGIDYDNFDMVVN